MPPGRPLSALARLTRRAARMPADVLAWPWRTGRGVWRLKSGWPAMRAAQVEAVRLSIEADGHQVDLYTDRDLTRWRGAHVKRLGET